MVPHIAYFFWSRGVPLCYMRLLTLRTFRALNPGWTIILYLGTSPADARTWGTRDQQDFQRPAGLEDYITLAQNYCNEVRDYKEHTDVAPNFQSDFFRWWRLASGGGWYFDLDIMFVRPMPETAESSRVVYGCRTMPYAGVLGVAPNACRIAHEVSISMQARYNPGDYCSIGPQMMRDLARRTDEFAVLDNHVFYPVHDSNAIMQIWCDYWRPPPGCVGVHWYAGHPDVQRYKRRVTPQTCLWSEDGWAVALRERGLI